MNLRLILCVIIICSFPLFVSCQTKKTDVLTQKNVRIDSKKPTVFLEFVKTEKRNEEIIIAANSESTPVIRTEEIDAVILRLHNNSPWAIQLKTGFDPFPKSELNTLQDKRLVQFFQPDSEQELMYGVEVINAEAPVTANLRRKLPYIRSYSSYGDIWVASGQSVTFVVRREELRRNLQVFMPFRYEWETSETNKGYDEPQHRVYFNWSQFENAAGL